jgi:hypothetical protein
MNNLALKEPNYPSDNLANAKSPSLEANLTNFNN